LAFQIKFKALFVDKLEQTAAILHDVGKKELFFGEFNVERL